MVDTREAKEALADQSGIREANLGPGPIAAKQGQAFLNRLAELRDLLNQSAVDLEAAVYSLLGGEAPLAKKEIVHPHAKPIDGFFPATDSALADAERHAAAIRKAVDKLKERF